MLPRLESLVPLQARLEERHLGELAEENAARIRALHRAVHDVTAPAIQLKEVDNWAQRVRRYLSTNASQEASAAVARCFLCESPVHPSRTSRQAYENLEHLGLLTGQLDAASTSQGLVEAGQRHALALHQVVHDPTYPGVDYASIIGWQVEAEKAYRSAYSWTMDGVPYVETVWLSLLSWAGFMLTGMLLVASAMEALTLVQICALLLVAVWIPWCVLYVRRSRPLGVGLSTAVWLTVLFPLAMAILAIAFVWRNPARTAVRHSRVKSGLPVASVARRDDWLPRSRP